MSNRYLLILLSLVLFTSGCAKNIFAEEDPEPEPYRGYFEVNKKRYDIVGFRGVEDNGNGRFYLTANAADAEGFGAPGIHSYCTINFKGGAPVTAQYPIAWNWDTLSSVKRRLYIELKDVYIGYEFTSTNEPTIKADVTVESEDKIGIKVPEIWVYPGFGNKVDSVLFSCEIIKSK